MIRSTSTLEAPHVEAAPLSAKDIHTALVHNIDLFASIVMPDYFSVKFAPFHQEIFDIWDSDDEYVMLIMPRGWGKTTLVQMLMAREGLYARSKFTLFISDTNDQAEEKLEALKEEFASNERIISLFGEQHNKKKWLKGNYTINNGCTYKSKGAGQSMRGIKEGFRRPDLIIVDDLENDESVGTPQQREKLHKWFYAVLLPTAIRKGKRVRVVGTIIEAESFLTTIMEQTQVEVDAGLRPTWKILRYGELDQKGKSLWPAFKPTEQILGEKQEYKSANRLDVWYRERMSTIVSENGRLPPKYIKHLTYGNEYELREAMNRCIALIVSHDPAISTNPRADRAAIVVVGFTGDSIIVFKGHRQVGMPPDEQVLKALEYANSYHTNVVLYEKVAFQQALKYSYQRLKGRFAYNALVEGYTVPRGKSKQLRIEHAIRAALLDEKFYVCDEVYDIVREEMASFPNGKCDFLDSITQAISYQVENDLFTPKDLMGQNSFQSVGEGSWAV